MITLSFLKLLEDEGFGTIDVDLFFQKLTLDKKGVYIADVGNPVAKGSRDTQSYELLARGDNDVDGYKALRDIRKFLAQNYSNICELPAVPDPNNPDNIITEGYTNVELSKPSTITNVGLDAQNRIIYSMTGTIIYKEK
jgi:hypothetical protein